MIVQCPTCGVYFEDYYRSWVCPHNTFPANNGRNEFEVNEDAYRGPVHPGEKDAYLSPYAPYKTQDFTIHFSPEIPDADDS